MGPKSVERLLNAHQGAGQLALARPRICYLDGSLGHTSIAFCPRVDHASWLDRTDYLAWACLLMSREVLEAAGMLDDRFFMC